MAYEFYVTPEEYAAAEKNGISAYNLDRRIRQCGWKKDRAMNEPIMKRCSQVKDWESVAVKNGISTHAFMGRVRRGWDLEEAASTPTLNKAEIYKRMRAGQRREFTDAELEQAQSLGVSSHHLYDRTKVLGWSKERAINTPLYTNEESLKLAQAASPFREMNDISHNLTNPRRPMRV